MNTFEFKSIYIRNSFYDVRIHGRVRCCPAEKHWSCIVGGGSVSGRIRKNHNSEKMGRCKAAVCSARARHGGTEHGQRRRQPRRARTSEECTRCARLRSITGRAPPAPPPRPVTVRARVGATDTHAPGVTRSTRLRVHGQAARSPINGAPAERRWRRRAPDPASILHPLHLRLCPFFFQICAIRL